MEALTTKLQELNDNQRIYIVSLLNRFDLVIKNARKIEDFQFRNYILTLVRKDYLEKIDEFMVKYDNKSMTYLKCFMIARIRNEIIPDTFK